MKQQLHFEPGTEPQWNIPSILDTLIELYNRENNTDYRIICVKKETAPDAANPARSRGVQL